MIYLWGYLLKFDDLEIVETLQNRKSIADHQSDNSPVFKRNSHLQNKQEEISSGKVMISKTIIMKVIQRTELRKICYVCNYNVFFAPIKTH